MVDMSAVEPVQLNLKSRFNFRCHKDISCFTKCCSNIDILLTPYDIVVLKKRLSMTSDDFLEKYTYIQADDKGVFPLVYLKMKEDEAKTCPFVTADGCTIYEDRPANCRYYAVGQGTLKKQLEDRLIDEEFYFLVKEKHCRGFEEEKEWTIGEWRENQGVDKYDELNREWKRILLIKNTPGLQINDEKQAMFYIAYYDMDRFRSFIFDSRFLDVFQVDDAERDKMQEDDIALMLFGVKLLKYIFMIEETLKAKPQQ